MVRSAIANPHLERIKIPCVHRAEALGKETVGCGACEVYVCALHGECVNARSTKGRKTCLGCDDYVSGMAALLTPANPIKEEVVSPVVKPLRWAYGVTTVPSRRANLLPATLQSLGGAGFDEPRLFVDGDADGISWEREFGLPVTARNPKINIHGNWILSLYELYVRDPHADRFAIFQDDLAASKNLKSYIDAVQWPGQGYLNLYTAPINQEAAPRSAHGGTIDGFYAAQRKKRGQGALALVFDLWGVMAMLTAEHMASRPQGDPTRCWRAVDGGVVDSIEKAGGIEWVHSPSLVQHTGRVSTFDKRKAATGKADAFPAYQWPESMDATSWRGEAFDLLELLTK